MNMSFKSAESGPKSYHHYVRRAEPGPGSFGCQAFVQCAGMCYFWKTVLIDILTTSIQNSCLLMMSPTQDISFKMTFQAMVMVLYKEWIICLTVVLEFKFSSSHLYPPHSAEINFFPKDVLPQSGTHYCVYIRSGQKTVRPILIPCSAKPRAIIVRPG